MVRKTIRDIFNRIGVLFTFPYRYLTAAFAGGLAVLAFAPFGLYPGMVISIALLLHCLVGATVRQAGWVGWWYGLGLFAPGLQWIFVSLDEFGQLPVVISLAILAGLFAIMAGYLAITCMVCNGLTRLHGMYRVLVVFPLTWILIEWLRGYLFSGFAWLSVGYSQIGAPLSGFAPLGGVSLVSLLTVISGGLLLMLFGPRREKIIAIALLLVTWTAGAGLQQVKWTSPAGDPIRASLVQANISQDQKWLPEMFAPTLIRYDEMTRSEFGRDFIIWPEVAIPALYHDYEDRFFKPIAAAAARKQSVILTGTIFQQADGELFNGLTALGSGQFYRKQKLVPFGEYFPVPDRVRNWLRLMNLPYTDFSAGASNQPLLQVGGTVIGTSICYEILFGNQIRRTVPAAQLLINISNDAWFGRSTGPAQHLEIARMRALETGRYLLRATGTGITAVIRPDGQLDSQLPAFTRGVLRAEVLPMQGATPFVRWGDWPLLTLAVLVLGISWRRIS